MPRSSGARRATRACVSSASRPATHSPILYVGRAARVIASSRGFETFGMSVIEAYSRGVPVLARRRGSYIELVEGSGAGMTFADADELEQCMRAMLARRRAHARMGERAYALFRAAYSEDAVLPRYFDLVHRFRRARVHARRRSHGPRRLRAYESDPHLSLRR